MEKNKNLTLAIAAIVISVSIAVVIIAGGIAIREAPAEDAEWIIRSYGNNVALYNGEEVIEVYGAISLDTLPDSDKRLLDNGIVFPSREEALLALEDYDG